MDLPRRRKILSDKATATVRETGSGTGLYPTAIFSLVQHPNRAICIYKTENRGSNISTGRSGYPPTSTARSISARGADSPGEVPI